MKTGVINLERCAIFAVVAFLVFGFFWGVYEYETNERPVLQAQRKEFLAEVKNHPPPLAPPKPVKSVTRTDYTLNVNFFDGTTQKIELEAGKKDYVFWYKGVKHSIQFKRWSKCSIPFSDNDPVRCKWFEGAFYMNYGYQTQPNSITHGISN